LPVRQVPRRREWPTDEQLVRRAQVGDHAASSLLVERHLSLGRRLALRYGNLGLSYDDLVQEGSIGLLEAIERYDRTRGAGFRTFAHWCVRRAMTHALTERGHVLRLPKRVLERRTTVTAAAALLASRNGHEATPAELAEETGLTVAEVREVLAAPVELASLDEFVGRGDVSLLATVQDANAPDPADAASARELHEIIEAALACLPADEQLVVRQHFGLDGAPRPLREIAGDVDMSLVKARAVKNRALYHLARGLRAASVTERARAGLRHASSAALAVGPLLVALAARIADLFDRTDPKPPF